MLSGTWSLAIDEETGVPITTIRGELTESDFRQYVTDGRSVPAFWHASKSLWDLRQVTQFPPTSEIHSLARFVQTYLAPPYQVAIVVSQEVHFGLSRMFEMMSEQPGVERHIFRDYDRAWAWLVGEGPPHV